MVSNIYIILTKNYPSVVGIFTVVIHLWQFIVLQYDLWMSVVQESSADLPVWWLWVFVVQSCLITVHLLKEKSKGKGKTTTIQAWTGPEGFGRLGLPDFKTIDI
jgi:hypothetical protein